MLRVALINGSPKGTKSHSEHIIEEMKYELEGVQIEEIQMPSSSPEGWRRFCAVMRQYLYFHYM